MAGVVIDLLGEVETVRVAPFRRLIAPYGELNIMPAEELLVERVYMADLRSPPDRSAQACARKFMAVCVAGGLPVDWAAVEKIAKGREYDNLDKVSRLRREMEKQHGQDKN